MSVLIRPLTEKLSRIQEQDGKYAFEVQTGANKPEIKKAVETLYPGVKVAKVNTLIMPSKPKGVILKVVFKGRTKTYKKAIVSVKEGTIDFFEEI